MRKTKYTYLQEEEIIESYIYSGANVTRVCDDYEIDRTTFYNILKRHNKTIKQLDEEYDAYRKEMKALCKEKWGVDLNV